MHDALLAQARTGDEAACSDLLARERPRMEAWIAGLVVREADRLDVQQDALVDVWRGLPGFDPMQALGPWLKTICRNRVAKFFRDRARHQPPGHLAVNEALLEASASDPAAWDQNAERVAALRQCLNDLDPKHRRLIEARASGAAVQELARLNGKSPNAMSMILLRCKNALLNCVTRRLGSAP